MVTPYRYPRIGGDESARPADPQVTRVADPDQTVRTTAHDPRAATIPAPAPTTRAYAERPALERAECDLLPALALVRRAALALDGARLDAAAVRTAHRAVLDALAGVRRGLDTEGHVASVTSPAAGREDGRGE